MTRQLRLLNFSILFSIIAQLGQAQHVVKGRVLGNDGGSVPNCNVVVKGKSVWTTTDFDGFFELTVPSSDDVLIFSFIGLKSKEVAIKGRSYLDIVLKYDCTVHFWDYRKVSFYALAGAIQSTYGGKILLSLPKDLLFNTKGPLIGDLTYQANRNDDLFLRSSLEYRHFIYDCGYSADINVRYRNIDINRFSSWVYAVEGDFNFKQHTLTLGYSGLRQDILTAGFEEFRTFSAPVIGLGTKIFKSSTSIRGKISLFGTQKVIEGELKYDFKKLSVFLNYYEFDTFSELSLGAGLNLSYSLKRKSG
ncbi:MAG: carboxypeptidase-like regulatory domain-containing protein [Cytophagales bacterium]|nr:carboxypeptidase-like regulatory domain-containing protein [Cytophagales bacterium]